MNLLACLIYSIEVVRDLDRTAAYCAGPLLINRFKADTNKRETMVNLLTNDAL